MAKIYNQQSVREEGIKMYTYKYERPCVTVDILLFSTRGQTPEILLIQRKNEPFQGEWAIPGGFIEMDESLEQAAVRELKEETNIDISEEKLEQFYTFGKPDRDPRTRVITVAYFAIIDSDDVQPEAYSDAPDVRWFSCDHLPPLAFDHQKILDMALNSDFADHD